MERDAEKDLAMCEAATPGPWFRSGGKWCSEVTTDLESGPESWICQLWFRDDENMDNWFNNANFIAEAREALPYWIQRAVAAEAEIERLRKAFEQIMETPKDWPESYDKAYGSCIRIAAKALAGDES